MATAGQERLARAVLDDAFAAAVDERRAELAVHESAAASARRAVERAERRLRRWRLHGTFDHDVGLRAVAMAQVADLAETDLPAGVHLQALSVYLAEHQPTDRREPPGPEPARRWFRPRRTRTSE